MNSIVETGGGGVLVSGGEKERERERNGRNGWNNNFFLLAGDFWLDIFVVKGMTDRRVLFGDRYRSLRFIVSPEGNLFSLENMRMYARWNFRLKAIFRGLEKNQFIPSKWTRKKVNGRTTRIYPRGRNRYPGSD